MTAHARGQQQQPQTMWIQHTAAADSDSPVGTVALIHETHTDGDRVEFSPETGKAQVTKAVGEQLVDHYDAITAVSDGDGDSED